MEEMRIWNKPVTMKDIEPPCLEHMGDYVYTTAASGVELVHCGNVGEKLYLPDQLSARWVTTLGAGMLSNCERLRDATLPRSLRRIGDYAFFQCENLEEVHMGQDVKEIGDHAFSGCRKLRNVYVPPTVESIGEGAFEGIEDLVLVGAVDSAAHRYARAHGMSFMAASDPYAA